MHAPTEIREGIVKFYIDEKLYGFVTDSETGEEIYIPVSGLIDEIKKNYKVSFRISKGKEDRKEAIDVKVLKR